MKKIILTAFLILCSVSIATAWDVTFQWDANPESDIGGYKLYQGTKSGGPYQQVDCEPDNADNKDIRLDMLPDAANPEWTILVPNDGHYYWVVTAFDTSGNESDYSNEVNARLDATPPAPPTGLKALVQRLISWLKDVFAGGLKVSV